MTHAGLLSARRSAVQLSDVIGLVSDEQWELPSACASWRVIDVVAHLGALAREAMVTVTHSDVVSAIQSVMWIPEYRQEQL